MKVLISVFAVLLIAMAVTGIIAGGVFALWHLTKHNDEDESGEEETC